MSLGVKQLEGDPFNNYIAMNDKGSVVSGTVKSVEPKGAVIQLNDDVEGYLRASEISRDRVEDAGSHLKVGDQIEVMIINIDRKSRTLQLSIKAKDQMETQEAMQKIQNDFQRGFRHDQPWSTVKSQVRQQAIIMSAR